MNDVVRSKTLGRIALIEIDSPPVNALSQPVRQGIVEHLDRAVADPSVEAILLTCAGRTFSVGADIREFGKPLVGPQLPEVIAQLEASPKLVVAAIHGTALGGGFEVALGCHYRVASESASIGLPEVKLGLLPGAGGTQRLPRLIGVEAALPIMVSGQPVKAGKAAELGAIDELAQGDLLESAIAFTEQLLDEGTPPRRLSHARVGPASVPEGFYDAFRASIARKARGYFAPERIIAAVQAAVELEFDAGMKRESELFVECILSPESIALRHVFFAERQAASVEGLAKDLPARDIASVALIGAGTMGG
jgi:3-hydroxyacyl-CoA dehydrogenase